MKLKVVFDLPQLGNELSERISGRVSEDSLWELEEEGFFNLPGELIVESGDFSDPKDALRDLENGLDLLPHVVRMTTEGTIEAMRRKAEFL